MAINPAEAIEEEREPTRTPATLGRTLPIGTRLRDYEITGLIGEGGFGIVYLAWDHSLQRKVAVKEYMPASMASRVTGSSAIVVKSDRHLDTFKAGLKSFVNEARLLARFDHPSLVKVYRFWEENGTAYMVMPFYEGPTLKTALAELGHVPSESELRAWLKPVLNAVTVLHDGETWHQNIGPDAIMLTPMGPVLLGFASAEHVVAALHHTPAAALKPGFAAIEQYGGVAETTRGPWTDLYALAAVVYAAITGEDPAPAANRLADDRVAPLSSIAAGLYSARFLAAIDAALAVQPERRPRDHLQFRALMGDIETPERLQLAPRLDLMQEPFAGAVEGNREITVPDGPLPAGSVPASTVALTPPPAQSGAKPKVVARAAPTASVPPQTSERGLPSWMRVGRGGGAIGKRAAYGLVAVTCVLIGVAALALEYYGRHAQRPTSVASPAAAVQVPVAAPAPAALSASTLLAVPVPARVPIAPPVIVAVPVVRMAPAAAASVVPVAATPPFVPAASAIGAPIEPVPAPASAAAITPPVPAELTTPTTAAERQARCLEILQKASLEPISPAETAYFKRECK
jgi:serine/threonine protein kinase